MVVVSRSSNTLHALSVSVGSCDSSSDRSCVASWWVISVVMVAVRSVSSDDSCVTNDSSESRSLSLLPSSRFSFAFGTNSSHAL